MGKNRLQVSLSIDLGKKDDSSTGMRGMERSMKSQAAVLSKTMSVQTKMLANELRGLKKDVVRLSNKPILFPKQAPVIVNLKQTVQQKVMPKVAPKSSEVPQKQ